MRSILFCMKRQLLLSLISLALVVGFILWWSAQQTPEPQSPLPNGGLVPTEVREPAETPKQAESVPRTSSKSLDLSGQGLAKVPEYVFGRTDLESLDLSDNILTGALQAEVRHLKNLRSLDLSGNNFTGVPAEIGQLSKLEILDLSDNRITGLPYELGNLSNLKILRLTGNNYSAADLAVITSSLPPSVTIETE